MEDVGLEATMTKRGGKKREEDQGDDDDGGGLLLGCLLGDRSESLEGMSRIRVERVGRE